MNLSNSTSSASNVYNTLQNTLSNSNNNSNITKSNSYPQSLNEVNNNSNNVKVDQITFNQLDRLSIDELKQLNDNNDKFIDYTQSLDGIRNINNIKNDLYNELELLANENISLYDASELSIYATQLNNVKQQVIDSYNKFTELQNQQKQFKQQQSQQYNINKLKQILNESIDDADRDSESYKLDYDNINDITIVSYIQQYTQQRQLFHERAIKRERLDYIHNNSIS